MADTPEEDEEEKPPEWHYETFCDDSIFARIPWLPSREKSVSFLDSDFCKEFAAAFESGIKNPGGLGDPELEIDQICLREDLHQALAQLFPFFLPSRYHIMDAVQMQKCAASPGSYWTNALHFVRTCSDLGTIPYNNLILELQSSDEPLIVTCVSDGEECKFQDFKEGGPEQCFDPAEFLLEPWVLLQLPFQPAMLHQWSVGALAEALKFAKRLVRIGASGHQKHFDDLMSRLYWIGKTLTTNCSTILTYFFISYCVNPQESLCAKTSKIFKEFSNLFGQTVAHLEFILSKDCAEILDMIQIDPSSKIAPSTLSFYSCMAPHMCATYLPLLNVYFEKYWQAKDLDPLCVKREPGIAMLEEMIAENPDFLVQQGRDNFKISVDLLNKFVRWSLQIRPIEGLQNVEDFLKCYDKHMGPRNFRVFKSHFFYVHHVLKGRHSRTSELEHGGVEVDILDLRGQVQAESSHETMMSLIRQAAEKYNQDLFIREVDEPDLDLAKCAFDKTEIAKANEDLWKPSDVLRRVKAACASYSVEHFPNHGSTTEQFQEHFTKRIRLLVLKMYEQHYATFQTGSLHFHPESHFAQYILPCFVAMITDVDQDPKVDSNTKINYKNFVHELIKSYENQPFVQVIATERKKIFHGRADFEKDLKIHYDAIQKSLKTVFSTSTSMDGILSKFRYVSMVGRGNLPLHFICPDGEMDYEKLACFMPVDSKLQFSRLCYRVSSSLEKINWMKVPFDEDIVIDFVVAFKLLAKETPAVNRALEFLYPNGKKEDKKPKRGPEELTKAQLISTALFVTHKYKMNKAQFNFAYQGPLFLLDPLQLAVHNFVMDNRWEVKSFLAPLWKRVDSGTIPLEVILRCLCCRPLRDAINMKTMKLKIEKQGEDSFHPVQHCRLCGLVNARPFRLCPECKDEPDYPHPNYFCSEKCEKVALDKFHTEEHAKFVMASLGI